MKNVKIDIEDRILKITVDLKQNCGPSKSGKSLIIATTEGNIEIEDFFVGLNIYKKNN